MKLSLYSSAGWRHPLGLSYVVALARRTGYDEVSIRGRSTESRAPSEQQVRAIGYDMLSVEESSSEGMAELLELFRRHDVTPYCLSTYASLVDPKPDELHDSLARIGRAIAFAGRYSMPVIRTIGHVVREPGRSRADVGAAFVKALQALLPVCKEAGVLLQIENAESSYPQTADEINHVMAELDADWCSVAFDPVNALFCDLDPLKELGALSRAPDAIHVKDVAPSQSGYRWTPVGEGSLPWSELLEKAGGIGFDGHFVCEYVNPHKLSDFHGWETLSPPEVWARRCSEYLRERWSSV